MRSILRGLVGLVALFNLTIGVGFLLAPARLAAVLFLAPVGSQGLATLRADFSGFFIGGSVFALLAAVRGRAAPLRVPLVLLALAFAGRCLSLVVDGVGPHALPPMAIEAAMLVVLGLAYRAFDRTWT